MNNPGGLEVTVKNIRGTCPVYEKGDEFEISQGYKLKTQKELCLHSLSSIMPYYIPLSRGVEPEELGLGGGETAYLQCLDPCEYTGGGTVVFEINRRESNGTE